MLKDELKGLRELIATLCQGTNELDEQALTFLDEPPSYIQSECGRVKQAWTNLLFSQTKDHAIRRYVEFQQQTLLEISDKLYYQMSGEKQSSALASDPGIFDLILENVLELNQFLTQYFKGFINQDTKIPAVMIPEVRKKMNECAEKLNTSLQRTNIDAQLRACILDYLQWVVAMDDNYPITYRTQEYLIQFTETVGVTIDCEDGRDLTLKVTEILFYVNFNHNGFCKWYFSDITKITMALTPKEQISMLKKQLLFLRSTPVMLRMSYNPDLKPVNILLENWLDEYIKEELLRADLLQTDTPQKLELKLTVAQLALLIRLLYEEGVFTMKNIAGLLRFFSMHFTSKKQEHISYGSMNKLYYSGDQFTGYAVKELLLNMVTKINKMFFPDVK